MADAQPPDAGSLSARADEILRRVEAQLSALRAPPAPAPAPALELRDVGELLDTVEAGVQATRACLVTLWASLERIAEAIDAAEERRRALAPDPPLAVRPSEEELAAGRAAPPRPS